MMRTGWRHFSLVCFLATLQYFSLGCMKWIEGPAPAIENRISQITIETLGASRPQRIVITEPERIQDTSDLFGPHDWLENLGNPLIPHYRIQLSNGKGISIVYWLGDLSDPPRPSCYRLCSGFWLASSDADNRINRKLYKPLATSAHMFAVKKLLLDFPYDD